MQGIQLYLVQEPIIDRKRPGRRCVHSSSFAILELFQRTFAEGASLVGVVSVQAINIRPICRSARPAFAGTIVWPRISPDLQSATLDDIRRWLLRQLLIICRQCGCTASHGSPAVGWVVEFCCWDIELLDETNCGLPRSTKQRSAWNTRFIDDPSAHRLFGTEDPTFVEWT